MTDFEYQIECTHLRPGGQTCRGFFHVGSTGSACVYNSETYEKLINPRTGLYFQSPLYVYDFLKNEVLTGKMA
ncbi:hypothetical protein [uncultured Treponema sp.]|uniref:hypothetical protein n=1 Tax=uncultured Treponema sp. TaxID=162155 RepID=UPI0026288B02|nr:hypothetical protein [uncultured Treponema sp.]